MNLYKVWVKLEEEYDDIRGTAICIRTWLQSNSRGVIN